MKDIRIVNRQMTPEEIKWMDEGFAKLSVDEGMETESSDRISFVALKESAVIGCSSGLAYKNGEHYSGWFFLTDLFVEEHYRSEGLGAKLLKSLEEQLTALGVKHIYLWTSGDQALKFYHRHAYHTFTEMEKWYSDGSNRVGLRKNL